MTTPTFSIANTDNPFDRRGPFLLSLLMTLIGYSVLVALPAINGAWVDQLGFSEVEVNRVASTDLLGLFLGAVITSVLIRRVNRQILIYLGIFLAVLANALCTQYVDYDTTLLLRLLAGLGAGTIPPSLLPVLEHIPSRGKHLTGCC